MKVHTQFVCLWLVVLLSSACGPIAAPTQLAPVSEPQPTSTGDFHSLDTRTGVREIDLVLAALESGDKQEFLDSIHYSTIDCMTINALGGPPPCREDEAEGTSVDVLPILGPEGTYLWKDEIGNWAGLDVAGLYAVYQVAESAYSDQYYPKGDYGLLLVSEGAEPGIVLQITRDGIVRIDHIMDYSPSALSNILERDAVEVILAPKE